MPISSTVDHVLCHTMSPQDSDILALAIRSSSALGLSDGSYMPKRYPGWATSAWFLSDGSASQSQAFYGVSSVGGPVSAINAYRAELHGIYSLLVALEFFCQQKQIDEGGIIIGCDNQGAIHQVQSFHEQVPCATPHADLLRAITTLRLRSRISLTFRYVPGHQDLFQRFEDLPPLQRLNVWADSLARQELHRMASLPSLPIRCHSLLGEKWSAYLETEKIVSDPRIPVLDSLGFTQAQIYWVHHGQLTDQSFSLVHWSVLDRAVHAFPHTFQMWLSKFASGHSAVGITMFRWKNWDSAVCPVCS